MAKEIICYTARGIFEKVRQSCYLRPSPGVKFELHRLWAAVDVACALVLDAEKEKFVLNHIELNGSLAKLIEVLYDAEDVMDEYAYEVLRGGATYGTKKVKLFFSTQNHLASPYKMAHKLKAVRERLYAIAADEGHQFRFVETQSMLKERDQNVGGYNVMYVEDGEIIGRDSDKDAIIELLLDLENEHNEVSVIPILGLRGLGKTTLAKLVYNDDRVRNAFELKIWVCASNITDPKVIVQKALLSAADGRAGVFKLGQLLSHLQEEIAGKKFLLVLDDVCGKFLRQWPELNRVLLNGAKGSRVMVTTCSAVVAKATGTQKPYVLQRLSLANSCSLFDQIACSGQRWNLVDEKIGKELIDNKCSGIPLSVKMVASLFCFGRPTSQLLLKWFDKLTNDLPTSVTTQTKVCYDYLPTHLKHCLAYCSLFPKGYEIDVKTLIHLWVAQGLVESSSPIPLAYSTRRSVEDIGLECFMNLWGLSFFQEVKKDELGNIRSCKMHDLVHDLASIVVGTNSRIINMDGAGSAYESTRHISCHFNLDSSEQIHSIGLFSAKRLRTFLLPSQSLGQNQGKWEKESSYKAFFTSFRRLRVFDIHNIGIETIPSFIKMLKHLRYLDVSGNLDIRILPDSVTELYHLQVLNVSDCINLEQLPKDIKRLVNLRHLYSEECWSLAYIPRGIGQLTSLRTLSCFIIPEGNLVLEDVENVPAGLKELNSLNKLGGQLAIKFIGYSKNPTSKVLEQKQYLQSLNLSWEHDKFGIDEYEDMLFSSLQPHQNLKDLTVVGYGGVRLSQWLPSLTNLVYIWIQDCRRCRYLPPLCRIPFLKNFGIQNLLDLEYIEDEEGHDCINAEGSAFFPSLKVLRLINCTRLKGWWKRSNSSSVDVVQFPCLSELYIVRCPELTRMPLFSSLDVVLNLDNVSVSFLSSSFIHLSKLKNLQIEKIEDLESLAVDGIQSLTSVRELTISHCTSLMSLPQEMCSLTSLQNLSIWRCPMLKERCQKNKGEDWPYIAHIPNIKIEGNWIQRE